MRLAGLVPHPRALAVSSAEKVRVKGSFTTHREALAEVLQPTAVQWGNKRTSYRKRRSTVFC